MAVFHFVAQFQWISRIQNYIVCQYTTLCTIDQHLSGIAI